jgi:hypothetical protein
LTHRIRNPSPADQLTLAEELHVVVLGVTAQLNAVAE